MLPEPTAPGAAVRSGDFATASASPATVLDPELEGIALAAVAAAARAALPALKLLRPLGSSPAGDGAAGGRVGGVEEGGSASPPLSRWGTWIRIFRSMLARFGLQDAVPAGHVGEAPRRQSQIRRPAASVCPETASCAATSAQGRAL